MVGSEALKGPAAKMMDELGMPKTALGVAEHYRSTYGDLFKGFVLDSQDAHLEPDITSLGLATIVTNTVMVTLHDRTELAKEVISFSEHLRS